MFCYSGFEQEVWQCEMIHDERFGEGVVGDSQVRQGGNVPPPTRGQLQAVRIMVIKAAHDEMVVVCQSGMIDQVRQLCSSPSCAIINDSGRRSRNNGIFGLQDTV